MFSWRSSKGVFLIAASVLWAAGIAAAQQTPGGGGGGQQPPSSQQQQAPGQAGGAGNPTTGLPDAGQNQAYADQSFVHDAMEGDYAQVEMSKLAQDKSSSPDVKQFSQKMVQIHTELNSQLAPAAKQLGVSEPKGPSKKEKKEVERLQALSGPDFDTAYIQAMAKQQQHDLKGFRDEAKSGQNPNVQEAAKDDEPVLTEHYQVLQKLAQAHNVTLESQK
jgi:putative membrane protein